MTEPLTDQELEPPSWETLLVRLCEEMALLRKEKERAEQMVRELLEERDERRRADAATLPIIMQQTQAMVVERDALKAHIAVLAEALQAAEAVAAIVAVAACEETPRSSS